MLEVTLEPRLCRLPLQESSPVVTGTLIQEVGVTLDSYTRRWTRPAALAGAAQRPFRSTDQASVAELFPHG